MMIDRKTLFALVLAAAFGWCMARPAPAPEPFGPSPQPRPVLTLLSRLARLGLWVMLAGERQPGDQYYVVHARVSADGSPLLNNAEGW